MKTSLRKNGERAKGVDGMVCQVEKEIKRTKK